MDGVKNDFESVNKDIKQKIRDLNEYLSKYNKLIGMYQDLEDNVGTMMQDYDDYI